MSVAGPHATLKFDVSRESLMKFEGMTGVKINCRKTRVKTRVFSRRETSAGGRLAPRICQCCPDPPSTPYENLARRWEEWDNDGLRY